MTNIGFELWFATIFGLPLLLEWLRAPRWMQLCCGLLLMVAAIIVFWFDLTFVFTMPRTIGEPLRYALIAGVVVALIVPIWLPGRRAAETSWEDAGTAASDR